jgi:hypothetical protein
MFMTIEIFHRRHLKDRDLENKHYLLSSRTDSFVMQRILIIKQKKILKGVALRECHAIKCYLQGKFNLPKP